ncbi:MAG: dipicolinate synthase subunit B [Clostridiales bacterium]|jgi:dipicolinate synthase subunit B|nr:dipicolinate synthase subunit B [Clostridiales bacterium]
MKKLGFAVTGSFCTFNGILAELEKIKDEYDITPILSANAANTDTRFFEAKTFREKIEQITRKKIISTIAEAEPIGPKKLLDILVIAPCTGNTVAKLANGVADTSVTLAAKAHLRNGGPLVIAVSTNDGLGNNAKNIGALMAMKNIYFVPFGQDDHIGKANSLTADFGKIKDSAEAALAGRQIQPVLLNLRNFF